MIKPTLKQLTWVFTRTGSFTFGGGSSTVVALERDLVEDYGWMDRASYRLAYAISRLTPGTSILATCTAVGWTLRGWKGAAAALLGASVPCSAVVLGAMWLYEFWRENPTFAIALRGATAAAIGIMGAAAWRLWRPYLDRVNGIRATVIVAGAFGLSCLGMAPVRVLLVAAAVSLFWRERSKMA